MVRWFINVNFSGLIFLQINLKNIMKWCTTWQVLSNIIFNICSLSDPPTVNSLSQQNIIEGRELSVVCYANDGNPSSTTFFWTKEDNPGFTQNQNTLRISSINRTSSGTYICTAQNIYNDRETGSNNQSMVVNVLCEFDTIL